RPAVVVRSTRRRRQRVTLEKRECDRIHRVARNRVAGKRRSGRPDRGRRIVDDRDRPGNRLREDPLPLQQRGHRGNLGSSHPLTLTLIVNEEERSVFHERATEHATVLVAAVLWFRRTGRL